MVGTFKKILIGTSIAFGLTAVTNAPSHAAVLTLDPNSIQFQDFTTNLSTTDYRTYSGGSSGVFTSGNSSTAIAALTDSDVTSNVELGGDNVALSNDNIGFSGTIGGHSVAVSGVTAADWAVFGNKWLSDFLASNSQVNALWNSIGQIPAIGQIPSGKALEAQAVNLLLTQGLPSSGDPNIGALTLDSTTGQLSMDLIGHYDLRVPLLNNPAHYATGNTTFDSLLAKIAASLTNPLQASEIAKVTIDGQTTYAYSFNATQTGITASDDHVSYTGDYKINYSVPTNTQSVPESSALFGLLAVGGLFAAQRKLLNKA